MRPRNLLVTAPAGRGKTALLVRWIERRRADWPVVFVPISIRYDTNRAQVFYQAVATALAALVDETPAAPSSDPAAFYKEKMISLLDRFDGPEHRCLLVIDGLDEATGWQVDPSVLPSDPPAGLKVVVSARQLAGDQGSADWRQRLGWQWPPDAALDFEVPPLSREGIVEVMVSMGMPVANLAGDVDVVGELQRLTEGGDPLLLELYVRDLWHRGQARTATLSATDLPRLAPGLGPYFRRWFDEQRGEWKAAGLVHDQRVLDALMALLACALGPVTLALLDELLPRLMPDRIYLSADTIRPLQRFVIGDGVVSGYVFSHPKLAHFVLDGYFPANGRIIKDARNAYLQWGEDHVAKLNRAAIATDELAGFEYLLQHYVQHLEDAGPEVPVERYAELLQAGWLNAWRAHPESLQGFARDAGAVQERLRADSRVDAKRLQRPMVGLGGIVRAALCQCSIRSVGASVPANVLAELVRLGSLGPGQAVQLARQKPAHEQAATFRALAPYLTDPMFERAVQIARSIRDAATRGASLAGLALGRKGVVGQALAIEAKAAVDAVPEGYARESAQREIDRILGVALAVDTTPKALPRVTRRPPGAPSGIGVADATFEQHIAALSAESEEKWVAEAALAALIPLMSEADLARLLAALAHIPADRHSWRIWPALWAVLPESLHRQAIDTTLKLGTYYAGNALNEGLPYLSDASIDHLLQLPPTADRYEDGRVLVTIAPALSTSQLLDAWRKTRTLDFWGDNVRQRLLPYLGPDLFETIVAELETPGTDIDGGSEIEVIAAQLSPQQAQRLLPVIHALDTTARGNALSRVGPRLAPEDLVRVASQLTDRPAELDRILPLLPEAQRAALIGPARITRDGDRRRRRFRRGVRCVVDPSTAPHRSGHRGPRRRNGIAHRRR